MSLTIKDFYSQAILNLTNSSAVVKTDKNQNIIDVEFVKDNISLPSQTDIDTKAQELLDTYNSEKQTKLDKKASGKQKLLDLGLTDDEIQALIGV